MGRLAPNFYHLIKNKMIITTLFLSVAGYIATANKRQGIADQFNTACLIAFLICTFYLFVF